MDFNDSSSVRARDPWTWHTRTATVAAGAGLSNTFVYSYSADTVPHPGHNVLWMHNPNPAGFPRQHVALLWRVIPQTLANVPAALPVGSSLVPPVPRVTPSATGTTSATTVNALQPGGTVQFRLGDEFARVGYAVQGLRLAVEVSAPGAILPDSAWSISTPSGWTPTSLNATMTIPTPQAAGHSFPYQYYRAFTITKVVEDGRLRVTWDMPLDFTGQALTSSAQGIVSVTVPPLTDMSTYGQDFDWSTAGPFWDVTLTVEEVVEYPLLFSADPADADRLFSGPLTLRNADPAYADQWNTTNLPEDEETPQRILADNTPFATLMVKANADWWRGQLSFSDLVNRNIMMHLPREPPIRPACTPLWEVQVAADYTGSAGGAGRGAHPNGHSQPWGPSTSAFAYMPYAATPAEEHGSSRPRSVVQTFWWDPVSNSVPHEGDLLPDVQQARHVYLFLRIGAVPDTLYQGPTGHVCGSNNLTIGAVRWRQSSAHGQCGTASACLVDSHNDHPAKDVQMKESDNSEEIDAYTRFANCQVVPTAWRGLRIPSTRCVECMADNQCPDGQFCWLDDGLCDGNPGSYPNWYTCDTPSANRRGVCREKSSDVVGKACAPGVAYRTPAGSLKPGLAPGVSGYTGANLVVQGNPGDSDFAEGTLGGCGEYRFYNASPPLGAVLALAGSAAADGSGAYLSVEGRVRTALWEGVCVNHKCMECMPGEAAAAAAAGTNTPGKVCLNGRVYEAVDVDGTLNTGRYNAEVGSSAALLTLFLVLALVFAAYTCQEAQRWRRSHQRTPLTCVDWLSCGAFSHGKALPGAPPLGSSKAGQGEGEHASAAEDVEHGSGGAGAEAEADASVQPSDVQVQEGPGEAPEEEDGQVAASEGASGAEAEEDAAPKPGATGEVASPQGDGPPSETAQDDAAETEDGTAEASSAEAAESSAAGEVGDTEPSDEGAAAEGSKEGGE